MKKFLIVFFLFFSYATDILSAEAFSVRDIFISAEDEKGAAVARETALAEGQKKAFLLLLDRIVPVDERLHVSEISDVELLNFIQDVSLKNEKTTPTKYMGVLTVRFSPSAVEDFLKKQNIAFLKQLPPRFLLIPVFEFGTEKMIFDDNPLYESLLESKPVSSIYSFVVPAGDDEDRLNITADNFDYTKAAGILSKYEADKVMIWTLRPSGGLWYLLAEEKGSSGALKTIVTGDDQILFKRYEMIDMTKKMISELEKNWFRRYLSSSEKSTVFSFVIPVSNLAEWIRIENDIKRFDFIEKLEVYSLQKNKVVINLMFKGSEDELRYRLQKEGFSFLNVGNDVFLLRLGSEPLSLDQISLENV